MAYKNSGAISLQQIQDEFGGSHPSACLNITETAYVYSNNGNVPTSGAIGLNNFYNGVGILFYLRWHYQWLWKPPTNYGV